MIYTLLIFNSYMFTTRHSIKIHGSLSNSPIFPWKTCCGQVLAGKDYDLIYNCVGTPEDWPKAAKVLKKGGRGQFWIGTSTILLVLNVGNRWGGVG